MNEVGLDPGIDHLLAMECFEEVQQSGGKVGHILKIVAISLFKVLILKLIFFLFATDFVLCFLLRRPAGPRVFCKSTPI